MKRTSTFQIFEDLSLIIGITIVVVAGITALTLIINFLLHLYELAMNLELSATL